MKILLLEDNKRLNQSIVKRLQLKQYEINSFEDGQKALDNIYNGYDCFILDINVPSLDGIDVLKEIRDHYANVPVIIISSNIDLDTIKDAYGSGCNDYLKKPFYIDELELKIEKLCALEKPLLELDDAFLYNKQTKQLFKDDVEIKLTKKENLLLYFFIKNDQKVLSYENIVDYVWEGDFATTDSLRTLVMRLRKKIPKVHLETIVDFGYKFTLEKTC